MIKNKALLFRPKGNKEWLSCHNNLIGKNLNNTSKSVNNNNIVKITIIKIETSKFIIKRGQNKLNRVVIICYEISPSSL